MTIVQPYLGLAVHEKPLVGAGWLPQYDWCFDYAFMSYSEHNGFKSGVCTPTLYDSRDTAFTLGLPLNMMFYSQSDNAVHYYLLSKIYS